MPPEGGIAEDTVISGTSTPGSPRNNKVKFLCSHGGKILPRPADAQLKYVGGETRVISVPRNISFRELLKKLTYLIDGEMVLKYLLLSEDLDALVSVKSDEDLRHMFDECDRHESAGSTRLRAYLFPASPTPVENQMASMEHRALEQRYVDAINGITRVTPRSSTRPHPSIIIGQRGTSLVSSACTSPRSPDSYTTEAILLQSCQPMGVGFSMHRVKSSPSLSNLNVSQQNQNYYQNMAQSPHPPSYQTSKPPIDPQKTGPPERIFSYRSTGRPEGVAYQADRSPYNYYATPRQNRGGGCCTRCVNYDDFGHYLDRKMIDRTGSSLSPIPLSPKQGYGILRAWQGTMTGDS